VVKRKQRNLRPETQLALLKGWQQIAAFLGQPISVAQRWANDGMPVKREGSNVPLQQRISCVDAMTKFFRAFVAAAAPGAADERKNPFHIACYMWWDIFPTYGNPNTGEANLHDACLNAMAAILTIPSELCQLSALHGRFFALSAAIALNIRLRVCLTVATPFDRMAYKVKSWLPHV
jgi:hypothetical protein